MKEAVLKLGPLPDIRIPTKLCSLGDKDCQHIADRFTASVENTTIATSIELHARFIEYCFSNSHGDMGIAASVAFNQTYLSTQSFNEAIRQFGLDPEQAATVTRCYYSTNLLGVFDGILDRSGQECLKELKDLLNTSQYDAVAEFLNTATQCLQRMSTYPEFEHWYPQGLDVLYWIAYMSSEECADIVDTLNVATLLVGLLQLANIYVLSRQCGLSVPATLNKLKVVSGHGIGLLVAAGASALSSADENNFDHTIEQILGNLMLAGCLPQQMAPESSLHPLAVADGKQHEGFPTSMAMVKGVPQFVVSMVLDKYNSFQEKAGNCDRKVFLTVVNGIDEFICSGHVDSLYQFVKIVREKAASERDGDQANVPFLKRKPPAVVSYVVNGKVPFHCIYLESVVEKHIEFATKYGWTLDNLSSSSVPFSMGKTSSNQLSDPYRSMLESLYAKPVDWPASVVRRDITHIVGFGMSKHLGEITQKCINGHGIQLSPFDTSSTNWKYDYKPAVVQLAESGKLQIDTPASRVLGMPAVFVGATIPISADENMVLNVAEAGYLAEFLIGPDVRSQNQMAKRVHNLARMMPPGHGITLCLQLNTDDLARWDWQWRTAVKLRRDERLLILGLTVMDSIPDVSDERTHSFVSEISEAGIRYLGLQVATQAQLIQSLELAQQFPSMNIVLQWLGGRSGGFHSYEEFHMPILEYYDQARQHTNVVLVAASGFGNAADAVPYLTGDWSTEFGCANMPFDGIMLGSRLLAASESTLDVGAKQLIVEAKGIDGVDIERLFTDNSGGILSVFGPGSSQPIHVIANRAGKLCRDLSDSVFSKPKDKQLGLLQEQWPDIAHRLVVDYMRPWFALKNGQPCQLEDMTYMEVLNRLMELSYNSEQQKWLDPTYRVFVGHIVDRTLRRLVDSEQPFVVEDISYTHDVVIDELMYVRHSLQDIAQTQLLASEDIQVFIGLCKERLDKGQKPMPFVPCLDQDFAAYMLQRILWECQMKGEDDFAQKLLIPQGPVSAGYTNVMNEPVKEILDGIFNGIVNRLQDEHVPIVPYIGSDPPSTMPSLNCPAVVPIRCSADSERSYLISDIRTQPNGTQIDLPDLDPWLQTLAGAGGKSWLHAVLASTTIVQGHRHMPNYIRQVLQPRTGRRFTLTADTVEIFRIDMERKELELSLVQNRIQLTMFQYIKDHQHSLSFSYLYRPDLPLAPIHEIMDGRETHIRDFFAYSWFGGGSNQAESLSKSELVNGSCHIPEHAFSTPIAAISRDQVAEFCRTTYIDLPVYPPNSEAASGVPLDFMAALAMPSIFQALTTWPLYEGLLDMVQTFGHSSFTSCAARKPLQVGDLISTKLHVVEIAPSSRGKTVAFKCMLYRHSSREGESEREHVATVECTFLYVGTQIEEDEHAFRVNKEPPIETTIKSAEDIAVLRSKEWFIVEDGVELSVGDLLEIDVQTVYGLYKSPSKQLYRNVKSTGTVHVRRGLHDRQLAARLDYQNSMVNDNQMVVLLHQMRNRNSPHVENPVVCHTSLCKDTRLLTRAPTSAWPFAQAVSDYNPHCINRYLASVVGVPDGKTLMPGLWTSTVTRRFIDRYVSHGDATRVRSFNTWFVGIVSPGDVLETKLWLAGSSKGGRQLIEAETRNVETGQIVLNATAEVAPPRTAYVYTGQGAQEPKMGMDLYETSEVVKATYDQAESHMLEAFGISLIEIIRDNPMEYTVYFGGEEGRRIRDTYMSLQIPVQDTDTYTPLLPEITSQTMSYTFQSPTGLLNATQFAQPAIVMFNMAMSRQLRSQHLFDEEAVIAGHSLGEYGALAVLGIMSLEDMLDVTFTRGMTMQASVDRDSQHRSQFAMVAANPSRVCRGFGQDALDATVNLVRELASNGNELLEIVNYNVRGYQYVLSGTRRMLKLLGEVLDVIHDRKMSFQNATYPKKANDSSKPPAWIATIRKIVSQITDQSVTMQENSFGITLERTCATLPIPGIDVPFHSSHLLSGAGFFRTCIHRFVHETNVDIFTTLPGRYIPNLTAVPYQADRDYFKLMLEQTKSTIVQQELENWAGDDNNNEMDAKERSRLARLLLIELLAYQFASPVRWIETQEKLLEDYKVQRIVEIGPTPTLCRLAEGTVKLAGKENQVEVLHVLRDSDAISYQAEDEEEEIVSTYSSTVSVVSEPEMVHPAAAVAVVQTKKKTSASVVAEIQDSPLTVVDITRAIIAQKVSKPLEQVPSSSSIRQLSGGKSTLQNEILGDLLKEFGIPQSAALSSPALSDRIDERSLDDLASALLTEVSMTAEVVLGKHSSTQISRLFNNKMPAGFGLSMAKETLSATFGIKRRHQQDSVMLLAITMEPKERLPNPEDAKQWLKEVVQMYVKEKNLTLPDMAESAGQSTSETANVAFDPRTQQKLNQLVSKQLGACQEYLGLTTSKQNPEQQDNSTTIQQLDQLTNELGADFVSGIQPKFDIEKVRHYNSYWNWARVDLLQLPKEEQEELDPGRMLSLSNRLEKEDLNQLKFDLTINSPPVYREVLTNGPVKPSTEICKATGAFQYKEVADPAMPNFLEYTDHMETSRLLHLQQPSGSSTHSWSYSASMSSAYFSALRGICQNGVTYQGQVALVTGCGAGSIGLLMVQRLLLGGARVIATTSSANYQLLEHTYKQYGARGSTLTVVPFNQASSQDTHRLIEYIYQKLRLDLDLVIPFAALNEAGPDITQIDSKSELSHRLMLTNLVRLLGNVCLAKRQLHSRRRPALVVLPLSPNHGDFGHSGLYGESKRGLEGLLYRWQAEPQWQSCLMLVGAQIGWTRGTSLMATSDAAASRAEQLSDGRIRTFATHEMAFNLMGLLHLRHQVVEPIMADFSGGLLQKIADMAGLAKEARDSLVSESSQLKSISSSYLADVVATVGHQAAGHIHAKHHVDPLINHRHPFPPPTSLPPPLGTGTFEGDLDQVVVICGYGEVGPYGGAQTRWEVEAKGELTMAGCLELAWLMGLVRHSGTHWVDTRSGERVHDHEMLRRYQSHILDRCGIRTLRSSDNLNTVAVMREIQLTQDMEPFESSPAEAQQFADRLGKEHVEIQHSDTSATVWVRLLKGASVLVPRCQHFDRDVGAPLPDGWDPQRLGIPQWVVDQVDPVTCYALVAATEALVRAGFPDPSALYQHFDVSEVGTSLGAGAGGVHAIRSMYHGRLLDSRVPVDVLQETFANTTAAWLNMLLLGSSGPIRVPTGGCATALVSCELAADAIRCGRAKVMMCGAFEGAVSEGCAEFARMGATADSTQDRRAGRQARELSRPCASTRGGFVESQGAGILLLMSASAALECGAPIYGVIAHTHTATDGFSRSLPAPGHGLLSSTPGLSRALASWRLTADDIGMVSFHGTGTLANDLNECQVVQQQLQRLGMRAAVPVVCQKHLTGHPKGPAGAWMLNGCLQAMQDGVVPGNRNADNIDSQFQQFSCLVFPSAAIRRSVKACLLKSFGFGQVGAEMLVVHPSCLLQQLPQSVLDSYHPQLRRREALAYRYWQDALVGKHGFVQLK